MAEAPPEKPRVRLFVALELPETVRDRLARWGESQLSDPALRPVSAEQLHVTLVFLGHRDPGQVEPVTTAMRESVAAATELELLEPVGRPSGARPRLFALPVRSEGAVALQAGLAGRLREAGLYEPEERSFWPHVTIARVRSEGHGSRRPRVVSRRPGALPKPLLEPFSSVRLTLYRSELQPRGARYVPLAHVELSASGRQ